MAPFPTGLGWCQHTQRRKGRGRMKSAEEIMNVLEAYDLTGSYRDAAELAGCSHHTVAHYVALRAAGKLTAGQGARRPQLVDEFLPKLEELVDRSHGRIRADVAHRKLAAMGFTGCERTTRRAVAGLKAAWRAGHRRVHRPWVPEPGMRIGEALGLRHEDLNIAEPRVSIVARDNDNRARAKGGRSRFIPASGELIRLYADYLNGEYGPLDSDYVFVNLWGRPHGRPLTYPAVYDLVGRLRRRTGIGFG